MRVNEKPKNDYESAICRLEQIIEKLEKGDLALQDSLELFEEGVKLVKKCNRFLDEADGKIKILAESLEEELAFKDFDGGF